MDVWGVILKHQLNHHGVLKLIIILENEEKRCKRRHSLTWDPSLMSLGAALKKKKLSKQKTKRIACNRYIIGDV